ncbi:MAG: elongation factor Ts [Clostridia bacterium]|nr:elongation factor Ts [Clostridia bacterium]
MAFTAQDVKTLRERTGCGMMDCKKALTQADGDMEKAIDVLREQGLAKAAKKASRIAAEGVAYAITNDDCTAGVAIEVNAETDFVAKNAEFQAFVNTVALTVMNQKPATVEELLTFKAEGMEMTVAELLQEKIQTIGENIIIRRFVRFEGRVATYIHMGGKIAVMVKFDTDVELSDAFMVYAKDVAMQIAAVSPAYLNKDQVPAEVLEHEKKIMTEQVMNEGKPEAIAQKIVMGKIGKYYEENCLVDQVFVKDNKLKVKDYTAQTAKALGGKIEIVDFVRFEKGEGLEKRSDDFAAEVASMVK